MSLEARALAALARAQVASGKPADAQESLASARAASRRTTSFRARFEVALAAVRIAPAGARPDDRAALASLAGVASTRGMRLLALEAALALAEDVRRNGVAGHGKDLLKDVERDALQEGLGGIAHAAVAARKRQSW